MHEEEGKYMPSRSVFFFSKAIMEPKTENAPPVFKWVNGTMYDHMVVGPSRPTINSLFSSPNPNLENERIYAAH